MTNTQLTSGAIEVSVLLGLGLWSKNLLDTVNFTFVFDILSFSDAGELRVSGLLGAIKA